MIGITPNHTSGGSGRCPGEGEQLAKVSSTSSVAPYTSQSPATQPGPWGRRGGHAGTVLAHPTEEGPRPPWHKWVAVCRYTAQRRLARPNRRHSIAQRH